MLGSFPSVKSREEGFYYAHKQNRFWRMLSEVFGVPLPLSVEEKKKLLLSHGVALWDVTESCEIEGSSDSSIKNVKVNDVKKLIDECGIHKIIANGGKAFALYNEYLKSETGIEALRAPSTSPANAGITFEKLVNEWRKLII